MASVIIFFRQSYASTDSSQCASGVNTRVPLDLHCTNCTICLSQEEKARPQHLRRVYEASINSNKHHTTPPGLTANRQTLQNMATKTYTLEEVKKHTTDKDCWLVIHGKVYDVTEFLEEHPGGFDIMLTSTGKDATSDFDEIGHSKSAHKMLEKYLIGTYEGGDSIPAPPPKAAAAASVQQKSAATRMFHVILPLLLLAVALAINFYLNGQAAAKKQQ